MVLSTFGCESTTEVGLSGLLTDGTSFRLERVSGEVIRTQIPYSFTNRTGSRVFLVNCLGEFAVSLQMQQAGEWVRAWSPILLLCWSAPIVIEPGEVYRTTLDVFASLPGGSWQPYLPPPDASTAYRIVWGTGLSSYDPDQYPFGELIPLAERVSNSFTLELPR